MAAATSTTYVSHVGEGLHSISQVPELHPQQQQQQHNNSSVKSLNLHSNAISRISGLQQLPSLAALNLSSNSIRAIEGLCGLVHLTSLNLASNCISELRGLAGLSRLAVLNVSYNTLTSIAGISDLHGSAGSLARLNLQHNQLASLHALSPLAGCLALQQLQVGGNPCTLSPAAYAALRSALPHVQQLDEGEAVSLVVGWQMAQDQLHAYDSRQQHQQQQQQAAGAGSRATKKQAREPRSPPRHADSGGSSSTTTTSGGPCDGDSPTSAEQAADVGGSGPQQVQHADQRSPQRRRHQVQQAHGSNKQPPPAAAAASTSCSTQTEEGAAAMERLRAEAQELRQQVGKLAGGWLRWAPLVAFAAGRPASAPCICMPCCCVHLQRSWRAAGRPSSSCGSRCARPYAQPRRRRTSGLRMPTRRHPLLVRGEAAAATTAPCSAGCLKLAF
jgi:hypothetical protein